MAALVVVRACSRGREAPAPEPKAGAEKPPPVRTEAERTQSAIEERMADAEYAGGLEALQTRQMELARLRAEAAAELRAWREAWLASNETARAIFEEIAVQAADPAAATNAAALAEKLEGLMAQDPRGRELLGKRDAIAEAAEGHQGVIRDFIGSRLLRQAQAGAREEKAAMERFRLSRSGAGAPAPAARPAPVARSEGWWSNSPPFLAEAAASQTNGAASAEGPAGP